MLFSSLSRQKHRPLLALSLPALFTRHLSSASASASAPAPIVSSELRDTDDFQLPTSLHPNPNSSSKPNQKKKPLHRPPSSLDPSSRPTGLRLGPGRVSRERPGACAPAVDIKVRSVDAAEEDLNSEEKRRIVRDRVQGESLTETERNAIVEMCWIGKNSRQINLGRDGLTCNVLDEIHSHWKHSQAVRIRCMGVPTVDMKNVCFQLEDRTFGKIILRKGGLIILYRGRNYDPEKRLVVASMLLEPQEPVCPELITTTIDGLSIEESETLRKRGLAVRALIKLVKNGYYGSLLMMVRDAFIVSELVRIDCKGLEENDYRKIGHKLRDLVPCILVTFIEDQIVVWRGKTYMSRENEL